MKRFFLILLPFFVLLFSCSNISNATDDKNTTKIDCPTEVKQRAFNFAELYAESNTEYVFGGQDPVRAVKIDCSGLIVMCYKYAMVDTKYSLLFDDTTAYNMYAEYSTKTEAPEKGDLIFMGESGSNNVTHIAIFEKNENGNVYFIDSTQKDTDGDGIYDINGVTKRSYTSTDDKIKWYGIMRVQY